MIFATIGVVHAEHHRHDSAIPRRRHRLYRTMLKRWRPVVVEIFVLGAFSSPDSVLMMLLFAIPISGMYLSELPLLCVLTAGGRLLGGAADPVVEPLLRRILAFEAGTPLLGLIDLRRPIDCLRDRSRIVGRPRMSTVSSSLIQSWSIL